MAENANLEDSGTRRKLTLGWADGLHDDTHERAKRDIEFCQTCLLQYDEAIGQLQ